MDELRQVLELTRVRVLLFWREPEALFWVFAFPLVLAAVLGFAFRSSTVPPSVVAVLDGPGAAELVERLAEVPHLEASLRTDAEAARRELRRGVVDVLVEPGETPRLALDPQRAESETARLRVLVGLAALDGDDLERRAEVTPLSERGSRYIDFLFPGLLGMNLMGTGMWSIGFAIAELRQRKLLRRLLVTPMRRSSFLASFFLARLVFLVFELGVLTGFGAFVLGVPFRGSVLAFAGLSVFGALTFSGLGLLAVSRVTTIQGASGMLNFLMMPMWLGSGVFFSYERFPEFLHPLLRLIPLTALVDALRNLMIDGSGLSELGAPFAVLAGWAVLGFAVGLRLFRWE